MELPQSAVRVRFGSRESRRAAKLLVDHLQIKVGDAARVVLRRNHADEETDKVIVGLEFFDTAVQLCEESLWSGSPPSDNPADKVWMEKPTQLVADLLVDMLAQADVERRAGEGVGDASELHVLLASALVGLIGVAYWYIVY